MFIKLIQFLIYSGLIVIISKYILVKVLRKLAESLNLKSRTVGNITGTATSIPELLTISFSAATGFIDASIYNVISSNIINLIQYILSIFLNKNRKVLKNQALKVDLGLVVATILIPILIIIFDMKMEISLIPIFILLFLGFYTISNNSHKVYLKIEENKLQSNIEEEKKWVKGKIKVAVRYFVYLSIISVVLFIIGNLLSNVLKDLCVQFNVSEIIIGILLGFITSIPELITFFESQKQYKKKKDSKLGVVEATNNLLTSNILNLFIIQSVGIIIYTIIF